MSNKMSCTSSFVNIQLLMTDIQNELQNYWYCKTDKSDELLFESALRNMPKIQTELVTSHSSISLPTEILSNEFLSSTVAPTESLSPRVTPIESPTTSIASQSQSNKAVRSPPNSLSTIEKSPLKPPIKTRNKTHRTCIKCNKIFHKLSTFNMHLESHNLTVPQKKSIHYCQLCGIYFNNWKAWSEHELEEHAAAENDHRINSNESEVTEGTVTKNLIIFKCELCAKEFTEFYNLVYHKKMHKYRTISQEMSGKKSRNKFRKKS